MYLRKGKTTMTVYGLNKSQLTQLKRTYILRMNDLGKFGEVVCNDSDRVLVESDLEDFWVNQLVSDETIAEEYWDVDFKEEDFI